MDDFPEIVFELLFYLQILLLLWNRYFFLVENTISFEIILHCAEEEKARNGGMDIFLSDQFRHS